MGGDPTMESMENCLAFSHPTKETSRRMLWIQLEREREEKLRALGETLSIGVEAKAASGQVLTSSAIPIVQSQPYYGTTANNSLFFLRKYHEWKTAHEYYIIRTTYFLNFSEN